MGMGEWLRKHRGPIAFGGGYTATALVRDFYRRPSKSFVHLSDFISLKSVD